jgi:hypothetical protein
MAGTGTGIGGIASLAFSYNQLSADLTNDIEQVAKSIVTSISGPPKSERVGLMHC